MWGWNFTRNNIPISCYPMLKLPTNYVCYELFLKWIHKSKRFTSKRTILIGKHQQYKHKGSTKRNTSNKIPDRTNNHGFFYFSRKKSYHVRAYEKKKWLAGGRFGQHNKHVFDREPSNTHSSHSCSQMLHRCQIKEKFL